MTDHQSLSFHSYNERFLPSISLDCVVFGYKEKSLHVLLLRYAETHAWALPGGFLPRGSTMEEVVSDVLYERTGVRDIFLQQYHTFSSVHRGWHETENDRSNFDLIRAKWPEAQREELQAWFDQRFVSTAFLALVDASKVNPSPDELSDACEWVAVDKLPVLSLDHQEMVDKALRQLRLMINYLPVGRTLLPERFTMSDLQALYEAILGANLDRGNFQRKIIKLGFLERHEKLMTGASNKAPFLYSINDKVYDQLLEEGIGFG